MPLDEIMVNCHVNHLKTATMESTSEDCFNQLTSVRDHS